MKFYIGTDEFMLYIGGVGEFIINKALLQEKEDI